MQASASEAVANNVLGTRNLLAAAEQYRVGRFVMISTDKAVNPTSVMGATKRLAELLVVRLRGVQGNLTWPCALATCWGAEAAWCRLPTADRCRWSCDRHPSRDVPLFYDHPRSGTTCAPGSSFGRGGEVFALDMGQPVRIVDLAHDLIGCQVWSPA